MLLSVVGEMGACCFEYLFSLWERLRPNVSMNWTDFSRFSLYAQIDEVFFFSCNCVLKKNIFFFKRESEQVGEGAEGEEENLKQLHASGLHT